MNGVCVYVYVLQCRLSQIQRKPCSWLNIFTEKEKIYHFNHIQNLDLLASLLIWLLMLKIHNNINRMISHFHLNGDLCAYTSPLHSTKMLPGASVLVTGVKFQFQRCFLHVLTDTKFGLSKVQMISLCLSFLSLSFFFLVRVCVCVIT